MYWIVINDFWIVILDLHYLYGVLLAKNLKIG